MKKTNLYAIRDRALAAGRAVYSVQQLAHLIGRPKAIAKVYASRLVRKGLARRLLRGKIAFSEDDFVVLSQLIEPSYVSLSSALHFHSLLTQVPRLVEGCTTRATHRYEGLGLEYHSVRPDLFFGYAHVNKGGSYAFVAEPEKALIDWVYLGAPAKSTVAELLGHLDREKLARYIRRVRGRGRKKLERWLL
ncbi:hypothetical protein J4439_07980 [Candidatus Woesearchaeota archaeon]|nr:hypothetical protein [Candidatus Woesearchaeota archaeon]